MPSLQSYGNAALKLHENGYIPIPIIPATKRPSIKNWSSIKNDYAQIEKLSLEYPHAGVGVLLNDLIVFDIDILDDRLAAKEMEIGRFYQFDHQWILSLIHIS